MSKGGEVYMVGEGEAVIYAVDINGVGGRSGGSEEEEGLVVAMTLRYLPT